MGREVNLQLDLDRFTMGDPCTLSDWENPNAQHEWGPGKNPSSKNIYKLSRSLRILNYAKMSKKNDKLENTEQECIEIFQQEKQNGYMDIEQDSPIYWWFHITLPLAVIHSSRNDKLRSLCLEWLYNFNLTMDLCDIYPEKTRESEILLCGMRGVDNEDWTIDALEWLHCGGEAPSMLEPHPPYYYNWYRPAMKAFGVVFSRFRGELKDHAVIWPKRVPLHIINYERGKVVFVEKNINSNTPCRQAAIYDATGVKRKLWYSSHERSGKSGYCPMNHARHRSQLDRSTASISSDHKTLSYSSEFFTNNKVVTYDLTSLGPVKQHRVWDMNGITDNYDQQISENNGQVVPIVPTRPIEKSKKGCKLFG